MKKLMMGVALALFASSANAERTEMTMAEVDEFCAIVEEGAESTMMARNLGVPHWMQAIENADAVKVMLESGDDDLKALATFVAEILGDAYRSNETTQVFMQQQREKCEAWMLARFADILVQE